ncbi:MAG: hypothetical protein Q4G60_14625 [bacterium]|nr:hypothetical protein [bacterium]
MIAYKGFNKKLQATMGKGTFDFVPGKTYEEKECKTANNGFHCAEDPMCAFGYYSGMSDRYFIVEAAGDLDEDSARRISCTKLTLVKEISRIQLATLACRYMEKYPDRQQDKSIQKNEGSVCKEGDFVIVRGKNPRAAGVKGSYLFLVKEKKNSMEIETIDVLRVDGTLIKEDIYYMVGGKKCKRKS